MSSSAKVFPEVRIEEHAFSRVILGHNPFLGYSYFSRARAKEYEARFADGRQIEAVIAAALRAGVRGMMMSFDSERAGMIVSALERACEAAGVQIPVVAILSPGFEAYADLLRRANVRAGVLHGQVTDTLFRRASRDFAREFAEQMARMRDLGLAPGASTHNGGETIPAMAGYDVAVVNTPVNKVGWRMCPCPEEVLAALEAAKMRVIAMKPLAMARVTPEEGMAYALGRPEVDMVVVGIASPEEAEETFGAARGALRGEVARV